MATNIDLVILVGQSNAQLLGTTQLYGENVNGSTVSGTPLQLACIEAGDALGLSGSGVIGVVQVGNAAPGSLAQGTVFGQTDIIPGAGGSSTNTPWF